MKILIQEYEPVAICLQETKCKLRSVPKISGYKTYFKNKRSNTVAHGGVAILVKEGFQADEVSLTTSLQAVAVKLFNPVEITICNICASGNEELVESDLVNLISQLGEDFIMLGDFNAHSPLWGGKRIETRGRLVEKIIDDANLCVLNTGESTHFSEANKSFSAIDLTLASTTVANVFGWEVSGDGMGSDHFPIVLKSGTLTNDKARKKWIIEKADWEKFRESLRFEDLKTIRPKMLKLLKGK